MTHVLLGQSPSAAFMAAPRSNPALARRIVASAAAALLLAGVAGTAYAEPGVATPPDQTVANVVVTSFISLTGLTENFTLTGVPGATVTTGETTPTIQGDPVSMTVTTNNQAGYVVTAQSRTDDLLPADTAANPDSIPITSLLVRDTTANPAGAFVPMIAGGPRTVHTETSRSDIAGDNLVNDFRITIPNVNSDIYSATLDYIATTS